MPDSIQLQTGERVPIEDTVCECNHWYEEHGHGAACGAPGCECGSFLADAEASSSAAIADRGGNPDKWPKHVLRDPA